MKREFLQSLPNIPPVGAESSAGLPDLPNLPFSEFGDQSNTISESSISILFSELAPIKHTLDIMITEFLNFMKRMYARRSLRPLKAP